MDEVVESSSKSTTTARLPRWTRQEILVLIQGKRVSESRTRGSSSGGAHESKWAAVSSYCRRHGVNRGPVQCRKRWSNLSGDYKKIKEWEANNNKGDDAASYWALRNDLRREKRLPGFFDREVYDILDGSVGGSGADVAAQQEEDYDGSKAEPDPPPVSEQQGKAVLSHQQEFPGQGQGSDRDLNKPGDTSEDILQHAEEGRKRKRYGTEDVDEEAISLQHRLIEALENNGKLFSSLIETHNTHLHLDREQRNEQSNSIATALNKLVDTLGRIADKL